MVELEWIMGIESSKLMLEISNNGVDFQDAKELDAFSQHDRIPSEGLASTNYFRLKSIEANGSITYSKIIKINFDKKIPQISVYPNPVSDKLYIDGLNEMGYREAIKIWDVNGKDWPVEYSNGTLDFSVLPTGIWFVSFLGEDEVKYFKVVKN